MWYELRYLSMLAKYHKQANEIVGIWLCSVVTIIVTIAACVCIIKWASLATKLIYKAFYVSACINADINVEIN